MSKILKMDMNLFQINKLGFTVYFLLGIPFAFLPFIISYIVDLLFRAMEVKNALNYNILVILFAVFNAVFILSIKYTAVFDIKSSFSVGKRINKNIIAQLIKNKKVKAPSVGEVVDILSYDVMPMEFLLLTHIDLVQQILYLIVTVFILSRINSFITIIIILPFLLLSFIGQYLGEKYKEKYAGSRAGSIDFSSAISDIVKNRENIQFFADNESVLENFRRKCTLRGKGRYECNIFSGKINITISLIRYLCSALLMLAAARLLIHAKLSTGDFTLYMSYIGFGCSYLALLKDTINGVKSVNNSMERIMKSFSIDEKTGSILFSPVILQEEKSELTHLNELQFVNFRMQKEDSGHSFTIKNNSLVAIAGQNGSGKTRFIRCLMGYAPYEGDILIDGKNINLSNVRFGYAGQNISLFNDSIENNVSLFSATGERVWQALEFANLKEEAAKWKTENPGQTIGANGKKLSEGQRQRLSVARAVYSEPLIYIFDDSFAFIDKVNRKEIFEKMQKLKGIKFFITNDANIINGADYQMRIENGCIFTDPK